MPTAPVVEAVSPEVVPAAPVVEAVTPEVVPAAPVVETPVAQSTPVEPAPVIYGGASPVVQDLNLQQNPTHQIYGGANPLENTQSIPIMGTPAPATPEQAIPVIQPIDQTGVQQ